MSKKKPGRAPAPARATARTKEPRRETIGDWLAWAEKEYAARDVALGQVADNAHDEALYLLLRCLGLSLESGPEVLERRLTATETSLIADVFRRRIDEKIPAAYLTKEAYLGGEPFYVDERVIIPRSYFVELLPEQIPAWLPAGKPVQRAVDICTGSGCLAVLLAKQFPRAQVDAIELSPGAAEVAEINLKKHRLTKRVQLWRSDVFDAVPVVKYDLIISNPPYVPTRELKDLAVEFKREPAMALDGGKDGLAIVRKILRQARERIQPHGVIVLEVGQAKAALNRVFAELDPHWLHSEDGEDCVCVITAARVLRWRG